MLFEEVCFQIADLEMKLFANNTGLKLLLPDCYNSFLQLNSQLTKKTNISSLKHSSQNYHGMGLSILNSGLQKPSRGKGTPIFVSDIWELWLNDFGKYLFISLREEPQIAIVIDSDFSNGILYGDFSSAENEVFFPLQNMGIIIYGNWLASLGDIILHASGVSIDGKGYCFIGESGAGKSTLARSLKVDSALTVLGEDQIILRYLENRFCIFGTPWHQDPKMCSPVGVPLEKIFFLERSESQKVELISPVEGVKCILKTAFIPFYQTKMLPKILDRLALLSVEIPFFSLSYQLGTDVWHLFGEQE